MSEYDSPWKEILDEFLSAFLEYCFPEIYAAIDWSVPPKMLDKEFQQITPHGELGRRSVDKLVEVRLLSGDTEWILIHLEIQNQWIGDFAVSKTVSCDRLVAGIASRPGTQFLGRTQEDRGD